MREEELFDLVRKVQKRQSEFQTVELKAAAVDFPKKIYDTLSSFSNQDDGGTIIFGISEGENYDAVGVYNVEKAQKKAMGACEQMEPNVRAVFAGTEVDGKIVLSAEIPPVEYWRRRISIRRSYSSARHQDPEKNLQHSQENQGSPVRYYVKDARVGAGSQ